jgi:hypothetical protein
MEKEKYILVRRLGNSLDSVLDYVETDVNEYLEEGYVLAGPLIYQTADNSEDYDWHVAIQPMIKKE